MDQSFGSTVIVRKKLKPPDAQAIARLQVPEPGDPLKLDGENVLELRRRKVAVLDTARRIQVISHESRPHTVEIFGRNSQNAPVWEAMELPSGGGTVSSFFDYLAVTKIMPDDDDEWTGQLEVGTNQVGSTAPQVMAHYQAIFNIGFDVTVDGTANCRIEATRNNPFALPYIYVDGHKFIQPKAHWFTWTTLEDITSEKFSDIDSPINAWRLTVNSGDGLCIARAIPIGLRT